MSETRHLMFVYGTLKQGQPNYHVMTDKSHGLCTFVSKGQTVDEWPLVIASKYNIPFLLHKKGFGKRISGEVYSVDDQMLSFLDVFESHPDYYTRRETPVVLEDGSQCSPWIYFVNRYKPELLELEKYDDYNSYGSHGLPYVESEQTSSIDDLLDWSELNNY